MLPIMIFSFARSLHLANDFPQTSFTILIDIKSQEFLRAIESVYYDTQDDVKELSKKAEIRKNEMSQI